MNITFLGTGSAMPTGERNQTGILLHAGDETLLIDCGSGVLGALSRTDMGYEAPDAILLTHHHLDHVSDLLPLMKARWLAGEEHLKIVGPAGTRDLVEGLLDVHAYLKDRVDIEIREVGPGGFSIGGYHINGVETIHSMDCLAYRVAHPSADGEFCFSGDSEESSKIAELAEDVSVLAHDCSFPDDIDVSNHPTPRRLGKMLADRGIGHLYLTHLYPHTTNREGEMIKSVSTNFDGEVSIAHDGLSIDI